MIRVVEEYSNWGETEKDWVNYHHYKAPISRDKIDIDYIAERIAKAWNDGRWGNLDRLTTESIIEFFALMNDDYDDFWSRGLRSEEESKKFVYEIIDALKKYGIDNVEDNMFANM